MEEPIPRAQKVRDACALGFTFADAVRNALGKTNSEIGKILWDAWPIEVSMCLSGERVYPFLRGGLADLLEMPLEEIEEMLEEHGTSDKRFRLEKEVAGHE